jgi:hypothetical protein
MGKPAKCGIRVKMAALTSVSRLLGRETAEQARETVDQFLPVPLKVPLKARLVLDSKRPKKILALRRAG